MSNAAQATDNVISFLARARERARRTSADLIAFSERVRLLAAPPGGAADARDTELGLATEELYAQGEDLASACRLLERERAKYHSLFDEAPDAYLTTNAKGVIKEANAAAGALLGMAPWFLSGKLLIAFVARQDVHGFRRRLQDTERSRGRNSNFSLRMRTRGAGVFAANLSARAIRTDDTAEVVGHLWLLRRTSTGDGALGPALAALAEVAGLVRDQSIARGLRGRESVPLAEVVASALDQAAAAADARSVRFAPAAPSEPLVVDVHPERLRRAVHHLMNLAASSASEGEELHVRLSLVEGEARLELAAEGAGRLDGSEAEILAIAAQLAADAGRLELPERSDGCLMCRVAWPAKP